MTRPLEVVVLACADLLDALDLAAAELNAALGARSHGAHVRLAIDVCHEPGAIARAVGLADRAAIAPCASRLSAGALQTALRRVGLDPVGVPLVPLAERCASHPPAVATARAALLLAAAAARARAFRGSTPDQLRPRATPVRTRRALLLADIAYEPVATIAPARCVARAGCDLCVAACPTGALGRADGRIVIDRSRCDGCAACLPACPTEAIELPGCRPDEVWAEVGALLGPGDDTLGPRGIVFACRHAALGDEAPAWLPVAVPSLRALSPLWVTRCLAAGANAVALLGCPRCADARVRAGAGWCRALLERIGADPDRVRVVAGSSALREPPRPASAARQLAILDGVATASMPETDALDGVLVHDGSPFGVVDMDAAPCTACGACAGSCPTEALRLEASPDELALTFDHRRCVACGFCGARCPEGPDVVRVTRATSPGALRSGRVALRREPQARCVRCGAVVAPAAMMDRIAALLGDEHAVLASTLRRHCAECRGPSIDMAARAPDPVAVVSDGAR